MRFALILQVEYSHNVHLIRGNHEAADINALFGFRIECIERMVCINASSNVDVLLYLLVAANNFIICSTGGERWNMGMASDKPTVQLASSGSSDWKENHMYAWWYWSFYKSCGTNWVSSAANYDGSRLNCPYGFIVVSAYLCCFSLVLVVIPCFCSICKWHFITIVGLTLQKMTVWKGCDLMLEVQG